MPDILRSPKFWGGVFLAAAAAAIYLSGICPAIYPGDGPELIAAAYTLGIPHPPGYPLYTLLGKLFTLIPAVSIAERINFMSTFFHLLTLLLVYGTILKITRRVFPSLIASLTLAVSFVFWRYSTVAEVFALNNFFAALIFFLLIWWSETKNPKYLYIISFALGLGLANHHTLILMLPAVLVFIYALDRQLFLRPKTVLILIAVFLIGLTPYLVLPIRTLANPPIDMGNPEGVSGLWRTVSRADYGGGATLSAAQNMFTPAFWTSPLQVSKITLFLNGLLPQFGFLGLATALLGLWYFGKKKPPLATFTLLHFLLTGVLFVMLWSLSSFSLKNIPHLFDNLPVLRRFYMLPVLVFPIWIGYGIHYLLEVAGKRRLLSAGLVIVFSFMPLSLLLSGYPEQNLKRYFYYEDLMDNLLLSTKANAIFFTKRDLTVFGLWYAQEVERKRPDVKVLWAYPQQWDVERMVRIYPELDFAPGQTFIEMVIKRNLKKFPIYTDDYYHALRDQLAPVGTLYAVHPPRGTNRLSTLQEGERNLSERYRYRGIYDLSQTRDRFTQILLGAYARAHINIGYEYEKRKMLKQAIAEYKQALKIDPQNQLIKNSLDKLKASLIY